MQRNSSVGIGYAVDAHLTLPTEKPDPGINIALQLSQLFTIHNQNDIHIPPPPRQKTTTVIIQEE